MKIRRLSDKAREVFFKYNLEGDIEAMKTLASEISDPRDQEYTNLLIANYYRVFEGNFGNLLNVLKKAEKSNKKLKDDILQNLINLGYYYLYRNELFNPELQSKFFNLLVDYNLNSLDFEDDWEKYYLFGNVELAIITEGRKIEEIQENIARYKKGLQILSKLGEKGEDLANSMKFYLGHYYLQLGDFEKAESCYLISYQIYDKYSSAWRVSISQILASYYQITGNLIEVYRYHNRAIEFAKEKKLYFWLSFSLSGKARSLLFEGRFEEALKTELEALNNNIQNNNTVGIAYSYYFLFHNYYEQFKTESESTILENAEKYIKELETFSQLNPDLKLIDFYLKMSKALFYKFGSFKNKAKAVEFFEELLEVAPNNYTIIVNLLDLLFENLMLSDDETIFSQVEMLIARLESLSIRITSETNIQLISRDILLARYYYYIKGDVSKAIRNLTERKEQMNRYGLKNLEIIVNKQLETLEKEKNKWKNLDVSLKEKIRTTEFQAYLQDALKLVRHKE